MTERTSDTPRRARPGAMLTAISAIRNASAVPVTRGCVHRMLATGVGPPSHLRALFGDVSLVVLARLAEEAGIAPRAFRNAYRRAWTQSAARNAELDDLLHAEASAGAETGPTGLEPR